jgi:hypothetical protein
MSGIRPSAAAILIAVLVATVARGAACWHYRANLSDDRDAYLVLAEGLHSGRGFSVPNSTRPTAYRPPLYPLILAPLSGAHRDALIAALHIALGGATAAAVVWLAAVSGLNPRRQLAAGLIVAIDPLLVYYSSLPMTETLATALCAGLLAFAAAACKSNVPIQQKLFGTIASGLFGLCVLCRPTFWAFAMFAMAFGAWQFLRGRPIPGAGDLRRRGIDWLLGSILTLAIVLPWPIRNWNALGTPILTTTHGGYTLLLGNNEAYYREVIDQPWGTIWDGAHGPGLLAWNEATETEMTKDGVTGEIARDRWMSNKARATIRHEPLTFLKACARRFASFWSLQPRGDSASDASSLTQRAVGLYYAALWTALILGLWRAWRRGGCAIELSSLMLAAFVAVHLIYWTDARMRAPIMPAIALFAAWVGFRRDDSIRHDAST